MGEKVAHEAQVAPHRKAGQQPGGMKAVPTPPVSRLIPRLFSPLFLSGPTRATGRLWGEASASDQGTQGCGRSPPVWRGYQTPDVTRRVRSRDALRSLAGVES
jgi:hypothetical protein